MRDSGSTASGDCRTPERFDRVEPDVRVGILERLDERGARGRMPLFAEGQRRLDAQVGIGIPQQLGERDGDVDVGHRQQLERAAEDVEVVMLVAQRRDERGEQVARGVPGQPLDRGAPDLPAVVAERVGERLRRVQRVDASAGARRRGRVSRGRSLWRSAASARSASSRGVTSSIVAITPTTRSPSRSAPSVTSCCMRSKFGDGVRGAHGIR